MKNERGRPVALTQDHIDDLSLDFGDKPIALPDIARVVYGSAEHYRKTGEMLRRLGVEPHGKVFFLWPTGQRQTRAYLVSDIRERWNKMAIDFPTRIAIEI